MKKILAIAGYDPSSGAGITKDLEVFASMGAHGLSVPTCIVLQGPQGVRDAYPVPYSQFYEMIDMAQSELPVDAVKIGVLWSEACVDKIASFLDKAGKTPLVIDPIIAAKNGTRLLTDEGLRRMVDVLFPRADVITPNVDEASAITGRKVTSLRDMKNCAKSLLDRGPKAVIIKGGHLKGDPVDLFYAGKEFLTSKRQRIDRTVHGTGCMFSSLITSFLAQGYDKREAFVESGRAMEDLIGDSYRIDKDGYFYASPGITNSIVSERWRVILTLKQAGEVLKRDNPIELMPEAQMDLGYAITSARGVEDVASFPGRIGCHEGQIYTKGEPAFGAAPGMAKLILACMRYYPQMRAGGSVRYDRAIIEKAMGKGLDVLSLDRKKESKRAPGAEGRGPDLLLGEALRRIERPPDVVYDPGGMGIEATLGIFAKDPLEITKKMEMMRL
jgi:hydroxymethylpyrimidine kinase / phosphomethylpyrimidine kinase / thiamine-phosphate diphosphorylase